MVFKIEHPGLEEPIALIPGKDYRIHRIPSGAFRNLLGLYGPEELEEGAPLTNYPARDVSRKHLTLKVQEDKIILEDDGSSGGTEINGHKLTPHQPIEITERGIYQLMVASEQFTIRNEN